MSLKILKSFTKVYYYDTILGQVIEIKKVHIIYLLQ